MKKKNIKRNKERKEKKQEKKNERKGINWRVVVYSLIGLLCVLLAFFIDWMFLIGTVICIYLNQKELVKKR